MNYYESIWSSLLLDDYTFIGIVLEIVRIR